MRRGESEIACAPPWAISGPTAPHRHVYGALSGYRQSPLLRITKQGSLTSRTGRVYFFVAASFLPSSCLASSLGGCSTNCGARASIPEPVPSHGFFVGTRGQHVRVSTAGSRRKERRTARTKGKEEGIRTHRSGAFKVAERLRELQRLADDALLLLIVPHLGVTLCMPGPRRTVSSPHRPHADGTRQMD